MRNLKADKIDNEINTAIQQSITMAKSSSETKEGDLDNHDEERELSIPGFDMLNHQSVGCLRNRHTNRLLKHYKHSNPFKGEFFHLGPKGEECTWNDAAVWRFDTRNAHGQNGYYKFTDLDAEHFLCYGMTIWARQIGKYVWALPYRNSMYNFDVAKFQWANSYLDMKHFHVNAAAWRTYRWQLEAAGSTYGGTYKGFYIKNLAHKVYLGWDHVNEPFLKYTKARGAWQVFNVEMPQNMRSSSSSYHSQALNSSASSVVGNDTTTGNMTSFSLEDSPKCQEYTELYPDRSEVIHDETESDYDGVVPAIIGSAVGICVMALILLVVYKKRFKKGGRAQINSKEEDGADVELSSSSSSTTDSDSMFPVAPLSHDKDNLDEPILVDNSAVVRL